MSSLNASAAAFVPSSVNADFEIVSTPIAEPDKAAFSYPFSCISSSEEPGCWPTYDTDDFCEGLLGEEKNGLSCGKFPDNIVEFYWLHEGHNDEDAWECLCKLDNGNYAYYTAWCDYTGFDCQGGMKLVISRDLKRLFYEGLTERSRANCIKEKTYRSVLTQGHNQLDVEDFKSVPLVPKPNPAAEATRAFIRVWNDGKELILNLDHVNGLEMDELEFAIRGLTGQFLPITSSEGVICRHNGPKPKKKFYRVNICAHAPAVTGIDNYFKRRFGNPNKKWELRMRIGGGSARQRGIRKWGKVEVSFILY